MSNTQAYEAIAAKIIVALEKGVAPWVQPWKTLGQNIAHPFNAVSRRPYSGINQVILWMIANDKGYSSAGWMTYKAASELGGHVRKGEKATEVVYWKKRSVEKKVDGRVEMKDGKPVMITIMMVRLFNVFNIAQIDKLPDRFYDGSNKPDVELPPNYADWVKATKANIKTGGDRAFYNVVTDSITMPRVKAFETQAHYQATLNHELIHWTAHKSRLDRDLTGRFGDASYAAEELVAELGSAFVCADLGIDGNLRHAEYIGHWIKMLKDDPKAIITASGAANKAAQYLGRLTGLRKEEAELAEAA